MESNKASANVCAKLRNFGDIHSLTLNSPLFVSTVAETFVKGKNLFFISDLSRMSGDTDQDDK